MPVIGLVVACRRNGGSLGRRGRRRRQRCHRFWCGIINGVLAAVASAAVNDSQWSPQDEVVPYSKDVSFMKHLI